MAVDMFFKLGDIKGESQDASHKEEIDVLAWSWRTPVWFSFRVERRWRGRKGELPGLVNHEMGRQFQR